MKKVFIICSMFFAFNVSALTPNLIYQENIYSNRLDSNNKIHSGLMALMSIDNKIVYCLDPYMVVGNEYVENNTYEINDDDLEYFKLVAYYGYNKDDRNSIYYYMASQELIWERILNGDKVFWSTGRYNEGDRINIDVYKNEIIENINNFYTLPSFDNDTISVFKDEESIISDNNFVLDNYIVYSPDLNVRQLDNAIGVYPYDIKDSVVNLRRDISFDNDTKFYTASNAQTLAAFGGIVSNSSKLNLKILYDKNVFIRFIDSKTNEIINPKFSVCELEKDWYNYDLEYHTYPDKIKDGIYNLCGLDDYDSTSFEVKNNDLEDLYIDIYLTKKENIVKKSIINNDDISNNLVINTDKKEKNIDKKSMVSIENVNELSQELPNTYDYEFLIYFIIIAIIWINIFYEFKNSN